MSDDLFYPPNRSAHAGGPIAIGQRVYCGLMGGKYGIVHRIAGEQSPQSVRSLAGGVAMMGGRAQFDVLFDTGHESRMVPECIMRGVQWKIFDSIATPEEIDQAKRFVAESTAEANRLHLQAVARRDQERAKHADDYPHLLKRSDKPQWSSGRVAAENIRRELKRAFPGFKFSVKSDHDSVDVYWTDGPTTGQVQPIIGKYRAGSFDGMTDCYEYDPDATFGDVFGDPKYTFCHRKDSLAGVRAAWARKGFDPAEVPECWENGGRWKMEQSLGDAVFHAWCECDLSK